MHSLETGDFYSSQGPEIYEISIEDSMLSVRCSPASLIVMYTDGRNCGVCKGEGITGAQFPIGEEKYIRIAVRDKQHRQAFSNAYMMEE